MHRDEPQAPVITINNNR